MNRNDYCFVGFSEVTCDITYNEELEIINKELGGTTFNILSNISRLSPKVQCYALGIFGEGKESLNMIHQLERAGVNAKYLRQVNKGLNVFHCIIPNDLSDINPTSGMLRDSITYSKISPITGESTYDRSCPINQEIPNELSNKPVIVILENFRDGTIPFLDSISSVQRKIIMDIGRIGIFQDLRKERIIELLKKVDIIQISEVVLNRLKDKLEFKELPQLIEEYNIEMIILTRGKRGTTFYYCDNGKIQEINYDILDPENEIDPSGAGDAFLSVTAILYKYYLDREKNVNKELIYNIYRLGNSLARKVVKQVGARCSDNTIEQWKQQEREMINNSLDNEIEQRDEI